MSKRRPDKEDGPHGQTPSKLSRPALRCRSADQSTYDSSSIPQAGPSSSIRRLVAAGFHQGHEQFNPETRNRQAIPNCLGAIVYHTIKNVSRWNRWDLDKILRRGDTLCETLQKTTHSPDLLQLKDMPLQIEIGDTMYFLETANIIGTVPFGKHTGEGISNFKRSLTNTLEKMFSASCSHLVRLRDQWASLVFSSGKYYYFDPSSRNTLDGLPTRSGFCVLIHFSTIDELVSHLLSLCRTIHLAEDDAVEITSIHVLSCDTADSAAQVVSERRGTSDGLNGGRNDDGSDGKAAHSSLVSTEDTKEDSGPRSPMLPASDPVMKSAPSTSTTGTKQTRSESAANSNNSTYSYVLETPSSLPLNRNVVCANFHQGNHRFSEKTRGRQCVPNSLGAIVFNNIKEVNCWTTKDLNNILEKGDQLYGRLKTSSAIKNERLLVAELPTELEILGILYIFEFSEPYVGLMWSTDNSVSQGIGLTLEEALSELFSQYPSCLISFGGNTEAIIKNHGTYYMFDPHARSRQDGLVSALGTCVLIRMETIADLQAHLIALGDSMNISKEEQFEITGVRVYERSL